MAAPVVRGRTTFVIGLSTTSPAATAVGDMVIVISWETRPNITPPAHTLQANFVELISNGDYTETGLSGRLSVAYTIATAAAANAYQAYTSDVGTTVRTGCIVLQAGTFSGTATDKGAAVATKAAATTNAAPNPPAVTLGVARDWLVIAIGGWCYSAASANTATVMANYANLQQYSASGLACVASAERALVAPISEDPAGYTDNSTPTGTASVTVAIPNLLEKLGTVTVDAVADIASAGTVETPAQTFERAASLDATGDIAASGVVVPAGPTVVERAASLDAAADIASSAVFFSILESGAAIDAIADIASAPQRELLRSASIDAAADVASAGEFFSILQGAGSLDAVADIAAAGQRALLRQASLDAVADIAAAGVRVGGPQTLERAASLDASADIAAAGIGWTTLDRAATVDATAGIASSGAVEPVFETHERSASLDATASFEVAYHRELLRSVSLDASAAIEATGEIEGEINAAASLDATASISVSGESFNPTEDWDLPPPQEQWLAASDEQWLISVGAEWPVSTAEEWTVGVGAEWPMPK
jgi:hypothetical protein